MSGVDSVQRIDVAQVYVKAHYGTPRFWGRYFSPFNGGTPYDANAKSETEAMWNCGTSWLIPISSPPGGHLGSSGAQGQADAMTFCAAVVNSKASVNYDLALPGNNQLYCYLDQEVGTNLSQAYWNGWTGYLRGFADNGDYPFYPALYTNPNVTNGCGLVNAGGSNGCYKIWSSEPEPGPPCYSLGSPPPSWVPETCPGSNPGTGLWQYAEAGPCGLTYVDFDLGSPNWDPTTYALYLAVQPP